MNSPLEHEHKMILWLYSFFLLNFDSKYKSISRKVIFIENAKQESIIWVFFFFEPIQGYKVYYTTNPNQPEASWDSQMVDNSELTTISELTSHVIYTVRVQAFTSMGAGPMSNPVKVKTQQGSYGTERPLIWYAKLK